MTTLGIIGEILSDFDEADAAAGNYTVRKDEDLEFSFDRPHSGPHSLYSDEDADDALILVLIIALLFSMFVVMLCVFVGCCSCIIAVYYKFHTNCKDYEILTQQTFQQQQVPIVN